MVLWLTKNSRASFRAPIPTRGFQFRERGKASAARDQFIRRAFFDNAPGFHHQHAVRFTGGRADVPDLLAAMSVFAFPSYFEGLGLVAVEAQAAGLHVIVTDNDAVPKEVAACPKLVTFVPITSPEAWGDALLAAPVRSVAAADQALRTLQGSRYDVQFSAEELCRFYESLTFPTNSKNG